MGWRGLALPPRVTSRRGSGLALTACKKRPWSPWHVTDGPRGQRSGWLGCGGRASHANVTALFLCGVGRGHARANLCGWPSQFLAAVGSRTHLLADCQPGPPSLPAGPSTFRAGSGGSPSCLIPCPLGFAFPEGPRPFLRTPLIQSDPGS